MTYSVYVLQNTTNNKVYVGFSGNVHQRWAAEKSAARSPQSGDYNSILSAAIRKHGWDAFTKQVIEEWPTKEEALDAECFWIEFFRSNVKVFGADSGYNCTSGGDNPPTQNGRKHSDATKARMSISQRGKKRSAETRARMSAAQRGRVCSEETRVRISTSLKGRPGTSLGRKATPETLARMSACRVGTTHSEETKARMRAAHAARRARQEST